MSIVPLFHIRRTSRLELFSQTILILMYSHISCPKVTRMWPLLLLMGPSPAQAGCPFLITEEHGALKVESPQAGAQASLPPQCAGNTLLTNSRGDQFCVARHISISISMSLLYLYSYL